MDLALIVKPRQLYIDQVEEVFVLQAMSLSVFQPLMISAMGQIQTSTCRRTLLNVHGLGGGLEELQTSTRQNFHLGYLLLDLLDARDRRIEIWGGGFGFHVDAAKCPRAKCLSERRLQEGDKIS